MFKRFHIACILISSCITQGLVSQVSCSAPHTWEIYRAPPQRWTQRKAAVSQTRFTGFLAGMRFGGSSLSGTLSVSSKQQGLVPLRTSNQNFSSRKFDVAGLFGYREWAGSILLGLECLLGWSPLEGEMSEEVLPGANYHTHLKQQGFMDAGLVLAYPWRRVTPMIRIGGVFSRFAQWAWSNRVMSEASSASIIPGFSAELGVETSWQGLGFRLSYNFKAYGRIESVNRDFLYAPYISVTQNACKLRQHTVALATFVRF